MHSTSGHRSSSPFARVTAAEPDFATEAVLEADFGPAPGSALPGRPGRVLLTGATGFLGAHLLRDLLAHTTADVVCLVRAASATAARSRIEDNLRHYGLALDDAQWRRVETRPGDLTHARFGLAEPDYAALAAQTDTVVHSAATVNFYQSYRQLRATNVGGMREILRFTVHARLKALHYVSSTGVFDSEAGRGRVVTETDAAEHCRGSVMGYTQAKWVAEQLVLQARARGVPASVYRAPFIMGDSRSGTVDAENLIVKMLLGSIQGGAWPDESTPVEMVPVDALSRAIVHLADRPATTGQTFHLASPQPMGWGDIGRAARSYGYPLELPSYREWKQRLQTFGRRKSNALRPLLRFFTQVPAHLTVPVPEIFAYPPRPVFDSTATQAVLAPAGLVPPRMTAALFALYLGYFARQGWLPPAAEMQAGPRAPKRSGSRPPYAACVPHA